MKSSMCHFDSSICITYFTQINKIAAREWIIKSLVCVCFCVCVEHNYLILENKTDRIAVLREI